MTQIKNQLLFSHSDGTFQLGERPKSALLFLLYNLWFIFCTGELGSENKIAGVQNIKTGEINHPYLHISG